MFLLVYLVLAWFYIVFMLVTIPEHSKIREWFLLRRFSRECIDSAEPSGRS